MCDYSLEDQFSRDARVGDCLVTSEFPWTPTIGMCDVREPGVAVCLSPGTELEFEKPIRELGRLQTLITWLCRRDMTVRMAKFTQVDQNNPFTHHDALELPDGRIMKLAHLQIGQRARVLQLPARHEPIETRRRGRVSIPEREDIYA